MTNDARLWSRDFSWWFIARGAAVLAAEMTILLVQLMVLERTSSAFHVSLLRVLVTLPYLLFGFYAGALADRVPRRRIVVMADFLSGSALLLTAMWSSLYAPQVELVLAMTFFVWSCLVFFDAGAWGSVLTIVGREKLGEANSKIWATMSAAGVIGPMLAAWIAEAHSLLAGLFIAAGLYFLSVAALSSIDSLKETTAAPPVRPRVADGIKLLWADSALRRIVMVAGCAALAMGAGSGVLIVYLAGPQGIGDGYVGAGAVFTGAAVGALAASALFPLARKKLGMRVVLMGSIAAYGVALVLVPLMPNVVALTALWTFAHFCYTTAVICAITVRQEATPADEQGRVNTSARVVTLGLQMTGTLGAGVLADVVSVDAVYVMAAAACIVGVILMMSAWSALRGHSAPPRSAE